MIQTFLDKGEIPQEWSTAILTPIPKVSGTSRPDQMRPLVLQNSKLKWVTMTILLMIEDLLQHLVPPEQKAFIKGRQMVDHIFSARGAWEAMASGPSARWIQEGLRFY